MRAKRLSIAIALTIATMLAGAGAAQASPSGPHEPFALPGQVEGTDPTRAASRDFSVQNTRCSPTWYCFFDGFNFTYPRDQLSDCGWQDLAWWGWHDRTESVAQSQGSPYTVTYFNHTTGGHGNDVPLFSTSSNWDERSSVPYRYDLIFEPQTYRFLGWQVVPKAENAVRPARSEVILSVTIVDRAGQMP